jgi:hypothetical protein
MVATYCDDRRYWLLAKVETIGVSSILIHIKGSAVDMLALAEKTDLDGCLADTLQKSEIKTVTLLRKN